MAWRSAVQRRTARIAGILRSLSNLVFIPIVNRAKGPEGWLVTVADVDRANHLALEIVTRVAARTIEDLADPIVVRVHRPDLVDMPRLQQLVFTGKVAVVFAEGPS
jgi:hypothetical protein